jgi:predicted acetylornithine/succinylornithine family transaminase
VTPEEIRAAEARYLVQTYARPEVVFKRGNGVYLYDAQGRAYLDFVAGIAVNALGHADPEWRQAIAKQAQELGHVSNLYHTEPHVQLARQLVEASFADRVFFSNSGSEANEAALKFARAWGRAQGKGDLVAFEGGFHGRTIGSLSLTKRRKYQAPFEPIMPGVHYAPFNDLPAAERVITDSACAVFVEPVQGEGGVKPADPDFLRGLRELCDSRGVLLVFDEVQCGLGRTGSLWAHQHAGVEPDVMTLAKPLAGGLPIGATLVTEDVAAAVHVGDHGSTFGGGPVVCSAALAVLDRLSDPEFLARVSDLGAYLLQGLRRLDSGHIVDVRGLGLMAGVEFDVPVKPLVSAALNEGLLVVNAGDDVLRLIPPLVIERDHIDQALEILSRALRSVGEF